MIGETIGHYRIVAEIGRGGMGVVYRAEDTHLYCSRALKFLSAKVDRDSPIHTRLVNEARTLASLEHPNICPIQEIGEHNDQTFIVMSYLEGQTLKARMDEGPIPLGEALDITRQITAGLAAAHAKGIVHRDVKPDNVMLTEANDGTQGALRVVLMDFGIAKNQESTMATMTGTVMGTAAYMSPEQARGDKVDAATDVWAVGVILFEMLSGGRPFQADSMPALLNVIVNDEPETFVGAVSAVPAPVERVIGKSLAKDKGERYADAADLLVDLDRVAAGEVVKGRRLEKRHRGPIAGAAAAVIGLVMVALYFGFVDRGDQHPVEATQTWQQTAADMIAVLPFSYSGPPEYDHLGDGLMDLLITTLDGTGDAHTVSSDATLRVVNRFSGKSLRGIASEVVNALGVNRYVRGDIVASAGRLRISAGLHDRTSSSGDFVRASVEGDASDLFTLVDNLTEQLLIGQEPGADQNFARLASLSTSLPALKEYLKGQQFDREWWASGDWDPDDNRSMKAYERATELDSTFALAWYKLSRVAFGTPGDSIPLVAASRAMETSDHLPPRERDLLNGWQAKITGHFDEAERQYKKILQTYPQDFEALEQLSWLYTSSSHVMGLEFSAGREFSDRGLQFDPDNEELLVASGMAAIHDRDWERFDELDVETYWSYVNRPIAGLLRGDQTERRKIVESMKGKDSGVLEKIVRNGEVQDPRMPELEEIAAMMISPEKSPEDRAYGHWRNAIWFASRGRWRMAKIHLDSLAVLPIADRRHPVKWQGLLTALPYIPVTQPDLEATYAQQAAWIPNTDLKRIIRLYTLGLLALKMQNTELVLDYANQLEAETPQMITGSLPVDFAKGLQARVAMSQGSTEVALRTLLSADRYIPYGAHWYSPTSLDWERYLQGELLTASGRHEEALRWFKSLRTDLISVFASMRHLKLGEVYERLGRHEEAVAHYEIFVDLWRDCDVELRPFLIQAEQRLDDLQSR